MEIKKLLKFTIWLTLLTLACSTYADTLIKVKDKQHQAIDDVIVYLTPLDGQTYPHTTEIININQKDKEFIPYLTVAQTQNQVTFNNEDDITHHIYSAVGKNKFSFKIKSGQHIEKNDFSNPGVIPMGCNIHDWMGAYLLVVDTPLFAKTNQQGQAVFKQDLTGKFTLTVWHPQLESQDNKQELTIELPAKMPIEVTLTSAITKRHEPKNDDFDFLSDYE